MLNQQKQEHSMTIVPKEHTIGLNNSKDNTNTIALRKKLKQVAAMEQKRKSTNYSKASSQQRRATKK